MPPKGHAILSASSSDRWLHCPPSARLCETYEDKGSDYAAEGTDAHELCEYKLKRALGMDASDPTENLTWYNEEMEDCANGYAAYILEMVEAAKESCADPKILIEQRVDFSRWVEQGFGTADCIIIADGTLRIYDYKHGLGVLVDATDNPQMKCYALGALELFDDIYDIDNVSITIYQPRRQNISTFEISKDELYKWADEVLKPTADLAFAGDGNFLCGEWCGFCKAKHECRARAEANLTLAQYDFKLPLVAEEVYKATWEWLAERRCASLVSPQLLERYAMSVARWIQCEEAITDYGFLAKHPTTGNAMQSPYVAMSQNFMSQTNRLWMEIYQIVKENCATEYKGETPMDDAMERLLRARKGN